MAGVVTEACDAARPRSVAMNVDTGEKTWLTPRCILDPLGRFDLDPCCPDGGMPWRTADRMVTKDEDGLRQDWEGLRVWLNPPYGREAEPFFRKLVSRSRGGGGWPLSLRERTRSSGRTTSSRTRTRCCSCAGACGSADRTGLPARPPRLRPRSYRSARRTRTSLREPWIRSGRMRCPASW